MVDDSHPDNGHTSDASPTGADKRRADRASLSLLVQFRFDSVEDFVAEYASDLSTRGVFIRTPEPREQGALVYLQFTLKDGSHLIEGLGRVIRSVSPGAPTGGTPGMGIEFLNFDEESMAVIERIVRDRLAKRR
jgi:uncharacterized protein (TIGR02266 family)